MGYIYVWCIQVGFLSAAMCGGMCVDKHPPRHLLFSSLLSRILLVGMHTLISYMTLNHMHTLKPTYVCTVALTHNTTHFLQAVTFQIVLVTDSVQTYVLLLYSDVRWNRSNGHGVLVGFNAGTNVQLSWQ